MKYPMSAALVAATEMASRPLPKITVVRACDMDWWQQVCRAVRQRCRDSYDRHQHCKNPFPVGDLRRVEWIEETQAIVREQLQLVMRNTAWAEPAAVVRLGAAKPGEVVPLPAPLPVPEEEEPQREAAKRKVNWECEEIYV